MENLSREIIVYKLYAQSNKPTLGYLRAVAEKIGDSYVPLTAENFCSSEKIFVTRDYEEINDRYSEYELFKVNVIESQYPSDDSRPERNCNYVTKGSEVSSLKPRELIEIIVAKLPDANNMVIDVINLPSTPYIYLNDEGICFGPFKWKENTLSSMTLEKISSPLPGRPLEAGNIYTGDFSDLKQYSIYCPLEEGERFYFENLTTLHNDTKLSAVDYSSDEEIINTFVKLSKDIGFSNKKVDLQYLEAKAKTLPISKHKVFSERLKKLKEIAVNQESFRDEIIDGYGKFLRSELGDSITKKYIENHEDYYLESIRKEYRTELENKFRDKTEELAELQVKIDINKRKLVTLGQQIEETNKINVNRETIDNIKSSKDLDKEIQNKEAQIEELQTRLSPLLEKYKSYNSLSEIENNFKLIKQDYESKMREKITIGDEIVKLQEQLKKSDGKLREKLFELKPFVEAINGNTGFLNQDKFKDVSIETITLADNKNNAQDILRHIENSFKLENRNLSFVEVINITVTLQQSFICFLAGLPGGGKTTLARLLAKIYGIHNNRFLDIPVSRGWTGQKDLIGFFNPISNKFQSSNTGLYEFLYSLSEESKEESKKVPLSLVLLDEANLSPMEHYWSSFMGITDSKDQKSLTLGDNKLNVPENIRFIATINYDSTTEYLSPRLIDRSPIIVLKPNSLSETYEEYEESLKLEMPISYETMEKHFGRNVDLPDFLENERRVYERVKAVLEVRNGNLGKPIIISSRKEIAIRQYCNKARPLMREFSTDDELLAFDYAVLQFILPLLRGHGKSFRQRLVKLKEIILEEDLEKSNNYLDTIVSYGDADLNSYDFFCW